MRLSANESIVANVIVCGGRFHTYLWHQDCPIVFLSNFFWGCLKLTMKMRNITIGKLFSFVSLLFYPITQRILTMDIKRFVCSSLSRFIRFVARAANCLHSVFSFSHSSSFTFFPPRSTPQKKNCFYFHGLGESLQSTSVRPLKSRLPLQLLCFVLFHFMKAKRRRRRRRLKGFFQSSNAW